jgi:glycosyltransferase involved in cell wall biosynthesis
MPLGGDAPRVSVVIATFNRARTLRCALASAVRQDFASIEILVVGDACTDESESVVAGLGDPRVHWTNRPTRCGSQSGPNNDAIARARGHYVAFLGHDDLWLPWHLQTLVPMLDAGADLVHAIGALVGPEGVRQAVAAPPRGEGYGTSFVPPSTWLVRREVLHAVGGFRDHSQTTRGTDFDLLRRVARAGYDIRCSPRLGALKFPSHWWRAYTAGAVVPQDSWLDAITADPGSVEREVVTRALVASTSAAPHARPARAWALAFRATARWLFNAADADRGPVAAGLRARFQRQRRALRAARGL